MNIELLFTEACPHVDAASALLEQVAGRLVPSVVVQQVLITSLAQAQQRRCYGSPTILIDGEDLQGEVEGQPSLDCRHYGEEAVPPQWLVEAGVLRALRPQGLLFLCVANSARSQIAEGLARDVAPDGVMVQSAGSHPTSVRPEAVSVLAEVGIDAARHTSKIVSSIAPATVDTVITLCKEEECPVFLGQARRLHWELPDPAAVVDAQARLEAFRQVRDELRRRLAVVFHGRQSAAHE